VLQADHIPPERHFHEFQVNIGPDPEDLFDEVEGLPDLLDIDESDDEEDSDEEDWEKDWYSDTEEGSFEAQGAQAATGSTSRRATGAATAEEERPGKEREAPLQPVAKQALEDLKQLLNPARKTGRGYIDPELNSFVRSRMEGMRTMLNFYTRERSLTYDAWAASSLQASMALGKGLHCARRIRRLTRQFIKDCAVLPINPYGDWNESMLVDEDLCNDINLYLQEIGKEISAKKLMEFLAREDIRSKHGIEKEISECTARRYLNTLGYRWSAPKKGQYADGHEWEDVVYYREQVFLPQWRRIQHRMECWIGLDAEPEQGPKMPGLRVIMWFHDESIFYAHDRQKKGWYHKDAPAKPYKKGDGASLMIADFVSADFGWLRSPDGKMSARRVMKPGKAKDGYFTSNNIQLQAEEAIKICQECWPQYEHVFIYDNASMHLKRPEDSLSARRMPKNMLKEGKNWGIEVTKRDPITQKPVCNSDGSYQKVKIRMGNARFADGTPQPLYFPEGHARAGVFKGMVMILEERGFVNMSKVRAECKGFKCIPGATSCCCHRILYNQPDFTDVPSILELTCKALGVLVIFLPKFHCKLNFIEQCWGYVKRIYQLNPESSREDHLEKNALEALEAVPLTSMRKFATRSHHFMDAYEQGLNGHQAAWATRKYQGHHVLPVSIMNDLEKAGIV
jgi:hypothetical protein